MPRDASRSAACCCPTSSTTGNKGEIVSDTASNTCDRTDRDNVISNKTDSCLDGSSKESNHDAIDRLLFDDRLWDKPHVQIAIG
jgi:hypothetical protein